MKITELLKPQILLKNRRRIFHLNLLVVQPGKGNLHMKDISFHFSLIAVVELIVSHLSVSQENLNKESERFHDPAMVFVLFCCIFGKNDFY